MVLESKDQLITENDLTLKPSVEKNNLSLAYHLSCHYSWDACPVGSPQMGQIPQRTGKHCHFHQTIHRNNPSPCPHPQITVEYLAHFQGNLGSTSPREPGPLSSVSFWSPDISAAEDLSKIPLPPFLTSTQKRSDTID